MTTTKSEKLKSLAREIKPGGVILPEGLRRIGISSDLQQHYLKSGWLEAIGHGAYKRPGDKVEWPAAVEAMQEQSKIRVHAGGLTALSLQGHYHYVRVKESLFLFSPTNERLPKWFTAHDWGQSLFHKKTSFLPDDVGIVKVETGNSIVSASSPERAIMEAIYLVPKYMDIMECYYIMEGLMNLWQEEVKLLLVNCKSVKVKRLFLYLAEKTGQQWMDFVDISDIDLGSGERVITAGGKYDAKYKITIPKELFES